MKTWPGRMLRVSVEIPSRGPLAPFSERASHVPPTAALMLSAVQKVIAVLLLWRGRPCRAPDSSSAPSAGPRGPDRAASRLGLYRGPQFRERGPRNFSVV